MRVFRLHRARRSASNYEGSVLYGGRWNPAGIPMLYASGTLSLACLELLVHLAPAQIPLDYASTAIDLETAPESANYRGDLSDEDGARRFGYRWAIDQTSVAILVPSVIIPTEFNVLLNPLHPDFGNVVWSGPEHFAFDPRLLKA